MVRLQCLELKVRPNWFFKFLFFFFIYAKVASALCRRYNPPPHDVRYLLTLRISSYEIDLKIVFALDKRAQLNNRCLIREGRSEMRGRVKMDNHIFLSDGR